jgi:polyisoprenoid-binding protein YceI
MSSSSPVLRRFELAAALLLFATAPLAANALDVAGSCRVQFFATTTLHDFEGEAPCALLAVEAPDAQGHYAARAEVAIAELQTGISARDKKMREVFEAKKYPRIVATFANLDPAALRAQRADALPFRIAIRGAVRAVTPVLSGFSEVPGKSAHFRASFELTLRDFGIEAPVAMGFIRVDEKVRVVVDVDLAARNGAAAASGAPAH